MIACLAFRTTLASCFPLAVYVFFPSPLGFCYIPYYIIPSYYFVFGKKVAYTLVYTHPLDTLKNRYILYHTLML